MGYNGSGVFLVNTAGQPVVPTTTITSTAFNLLTADLATGLTNCVTRDGQSPATANIPLGGFKLTGVGAPNAPGDALIYGTTAANQVLINNGRPGFLAYSSVSQANATGNGAGATPNFGVTVFDRGSNFTGGATFTAPVTGIYRLSAAVFMSLVTSTMIKQVINLNTSNQVFTKQQEFTPTGTGTISLDITVLADMDAADQASVSVELSGGAGNTATIFGQAASPRYTFFCGELVA